MQKLTPIILAGMLLILVPMLSRSEPFLAPGDLGLRDDLLRLNDEGVVDIPLNGWPIPAGDVAAALSTVDGLQLSPSQQIAFERVRSRIEFESVLSTWRLSLTGAASSKPTRIRSFQDIPRDEGEFGIAALFTGRRFAVNLSASGVADPFDGDEFRLDGSYVAMGLGNWILAAGYQDRWWGPGRDGSLILSDNARPSPGVSLTRNNSTPFASRWLSWIGPWSFNTFVNWLDDERDVEDTLLFGMRFSFRPVNGLEIGLSRSAQWCGEDRPCDFDAFWNMLIGKDNRNVNVSPEDEPGNQLGGIDIRWSLPADIPIALYMQWIGEDGRGGKPLPGSWLRQFGIEYWGTVGSMQHRTHAEVADTACRDGGFGFAEIQPDCAYEHKIYTSGYRYRNRVIGHGMDGDGLSYSLGTTLLQSDRHSWNMLLRFMEINRVGAPDTAHILSATPKDFMDIQISHARYTRFGRFTFGVGYGEVDDKLTGQSKSESTAYLQWRSDR